jgi:predicted ATPase/DNA-binding SARP family transcriptional activator
MQFKVFLLGRFDVQRDSHELVDWPRAGAKRLLKLLALAPQRSLNQERVAALLWPRGDAARVRQRLHHLVYLLRSSLSADAIDTADGMVRLRMQGISIDAETFEAQLQAALKPAQHTPNDAPNGAPNNAQAVEAALALYTGPLLPGDLDDPLLEQHRNELEQRFVGGLTAAAALWQQAHEPQRAIGCLQRVLLLRPADEAAHRGLIELFAALGEREAVERQYAACKTALADELGVVPEARTHQAYRQAMLGTAGASHADPDKRYAPPVPAVALIGRAALLDQLVAELMLPQTRLLTLTATGGMGKTLMALHAAQRVASHLQHGACWVSLAEVDASGVAERMRRALRLPGAPPGGPPGGKAVASAAHGLVDALRDCQLLLVCDNAEHVSGAMGLLGTLLDECPLLKILVTSRLRLNLRTERVFELPALDATPDAAMRLFEERARAVSPSFVLNASNAGDVQAIIQRLSGLPLAIELVAARTPLYAPAALRQVLEADLGLDLASGGGPDRPARHRSLDDSLNWSVALLSSPQRQVLQHCALFAAPFTADALTALQAQPGATTSSVAGALQALRELGLLVRATASDAAVPRWQLSQAVLRFLRSHAQTTPDLEATRQATPRFVAWYAALADRLGDANDMAATDAEHENFFAAVELASSSGDNSKLCRLVRALSPHWARVGAWSRADAWVDRAVGCAGDLPAADQAATLLAAGAYWQGCQQSARAYTLAQQALGLADGAAHVRLQARAVLLFASAAYHLGRQQEAITPLLRMGQLSAQLGELAFQRAANNNLATCYLSAGNLVQAKRVWLQCQKDLQSEPPRERVATTFNLSLAAHYGGRYAQAHALSEQALALERAAAPERAARLVLILVRRCWMWCCAGQAEPAAVALQQAREVAAQAQLQVLQQICAAHEGKVALVAGRRQRAEALLARGIHQCAAAADPWDLLDLRLWLLTARVALAGRAQAGLETLAEILAMPLPAWRHEHARILEMAATCLADLGRFAPAHRALAQAALLRQRQGIRRFPFEQAAARRTRAALRLSARQPPAAWASASEIASAGPTVGAAGDADPADTDDLSWLRQVL